jgi:hypothetical protein
MFSDVVLSICCCCMRSGSRVSRFITSTATSLRQISISLAPQVAHRFRPTSEEYVRMGIE